MYLYYLLWILSTSTMILLSVTATNNADQTFLLWAFWCTVVGGLVVVLKGYRQRKPNDLRTWLAVITLPIGISLVFFIILLYIFASNFGSGIG